MINNRINIICAIRSLEIGGAERQFVELVNNIDQNKFKLMVIVAYEKGELFADLNSNLDVICLQKTKMTDLKSFFKLNKVISTFKPDVVYTFMPDMNITLGALKILCRHKFKLIWGQFGSEPDNSSYGRVKDRVYRIQFFFRKSANAILSDGLRGLEFLDKYDYKIKNKKVIPSGTNTKKFSFNEIYRSEFRLKYNYHQDDFVVGICSRLDYMKGYLIFAEAAKTLNSKYKDIKFVSMGFGDDQIMEDAIKILGSASNNFLWLGKISSPQEVYSGWDLYCSTSLFGEGFSNSIIEAMSCQLPVIATDVGDAKKQLGELGFIIEPNNVEALVAKIEWCYLNRNTLNGYEFRERILNNFSTKAMVESSENFITYIKNKR
jgi:glycosyltransferase involved in cell wall biosynthesis